MYIYFVKMDFDEFDVGRIYIYICKRVIGCSDI